MKFINKLGKIIPTQFPSINKTALPLFILCVRYSVLPLALVKGNNDLSSNNFVTLFIELTYSNLLLVKI